jgi:SSS family transporter
MSLATFFTGGIIIYSLVLVGVGWIGRSRSTDIEGFTIANANVGGIAIGLSVFASAFSASVFMGVPGLFYAFGWPAFILAIAAVIAYPITGIVMIRRLKAQAEKLGSLTMTDYLGDRYDNKFVLALLVLASLVLYLGLIVVNLVTAGLIFEFGLGMTYEQGVLLGVAVAAIYIFIGGMWSTIITDNIQAVTMVSIVLVVLPLGLLEVGGISEMTAQMASIDVSLTQITEPILFTDATMIGAFLYFPLLLLGWPYIMNRVLAMEDVTRRTISKLTLTFWIGTALAMLWFISGGLALVSGIQVETPDAAVLWLTNDLLPPFAVAGLLIGFFAAIMSSIDSVLHAAGATIGNDLYRKVIVPLNGGDLDSAKVDRRSTIIAKVTVVAFVIMPTYFAIFSPPDFITVLLFDSAGLVSCMVGPTMLISLYMKRTTVNAVIVGMLAAGALYVVLFLYSPWGVFVDAPLAGLVNLAIMAGGSLLENSLRDSPSVPRGALDKL